MVGKIFASDASVWEYWEACMPGRVWFKAEAQERYGKNTLGIQQRLLGALLPETIEEIQSILHIANQHRIPLYPVSTGRNWGYGSSLPACEDCVIIDLSSFNKIRTFDSSLGLITLEPGVTQGQLQKYLQHHGDLFWVPVTGAGPHTSLVGNALERGFGWTPCEDHFAAVMAIEAILPNGEIYQTPLTHLGGELIDKAYKWGIGPYFDGLFSQGHFGIVTAMTLQLTRKSAFQEVFFFRFNTHREFVESVDELRMLMQTLDNHVSALKITTSNLEKPSWEGSAAIHGEKPIVKAIRKVIKRKMGKKTKNLEFIHPKQLYRQKVLFNYLSCFNRSFRRKFQMIKQRESILELRNGNPKEIGLRSFYYQLKMNWLKESLNPDTDGFGLIWFSPLVPMLSTKVDLYLKTVQPILEKYHQLFACLTLSSLSNCCFCSTVPLIFNQTEPVAVEKAHACYEALFLACQKEGFLPYRYPISFLKKIVNPNHSYWKLVTSIKQAIDPCNILSRGRYSP